MKMLNISEFTILLFSIRLMIILTDTFGSFDFASAGNLKE